MPKRDLENWKRKIVWQRENKKKEKSEQMPAPNEAVWRKRRCSPAETFVQIFKFASRPSLSEPPPASSRFGVGCKRGETVQFDRKRERIKN
jgi:hypothetical protein